MMMIIILFLCEEFTELGRIHIQTSFKSFCFAVIHDNALAYEHGNNILTKQRYFVQIARTTA